jgi:hypothetical protein
MGRSVGALRGLPGWPLWLSDEQAAAYVGLSLAKFRQGVATGDLPPGRMPVGEKLWSRAELKRCLDASPAAAAGLRNANSLVDPIADAIAAMEAHGC